MTFCCRNIAFKEKALVFASQAGMPCSWRGEVSHKAVLR